MSSPCRHLCRPTVVRSALRRTVRPASSAMRTSIRRLAARSEMRSPSRRIRWPEQTDRHHRRSYGHTRTLRPLAPSGDLSATIQPPLCWTEGTLELKQQLPPGHFSRSHRTSKGVYCTRHAAASRRFLTQRECDIRRLHRSALSQDRIASTHRRRRRTVAAVALCTSMAQPLAGRIAASSAQRVAANGRSRSAPSMICFAVQVDRGRSHVVRVLTRPASPASV